MTNDNESARGAACLLLIGALGIPTILLCIAVVKLILELLKGEIHE